MTAVEGFLKTAEAVVLILQSAGLIEGESLESVVNVEETDQILFWHALTKNGGGTKETYLVWNVMPTTPLIKADDQVSLRSGSALIDLFTRYSMGDETIQQLMKRINQEALSEGWDCELYEVPSYEPEFKRTRVTLQITKMIK